MATAVGKAFDEWRLRRDQISYIDQVAFYDAIYDHLHRQSRSSCSFSDSAETGLVEIVIRNARYGTTLKYPWVETSVTFDAHV